MSDETELSSELKAAIVTLAVMVRQQASNGNIQVRGECQAARTVGEHLIGSEFDQWVQWQVPRHIAINTALDGGLPEVGR